MRTWFFCLCCFTCISCGAERGTVGARFGRDADGHLYAREVPSGLGAANAGMREGDEVILVDGRDVRPLSEADLHTLLSGERGTRVRFTLLRGQESLRLSVERTAPPAVPNKP
jgi:C-terminal processing protease CtpA/Prc